MYAVTAVTVVVVITVGVSRLDPAAPRVDRDAIYLDTVQRGPMVRQVRRTGTLVPEQIRWIPATTDGTVERIVIRPGALVAPATVILAGQGHPKSASPPPSTPATASSRDT